jgi:hypothetical protein
MELLLNVIWASLALSALLAFVWSSRLAMQVRPGVCLKSLIALFSVICLLFPVVSASDDLHPTQAVLEDATKRIQRGISQAPLLPTPHLSWLPALLAAALLFGLIVLRPWRTKTVIKHRIERPRQPEAGRGPPFVIA